jgi:hypothetical protein
MAFAKTSRFVQIVAGVEIAVVCMGRVVGFFVGQISHDGCIELGVNFASQSHLTRRRKRKERGDWATVILIRP